jgi:regulator of protease activity HflC (stomatin/prohibitin superfamily)
MSALLSSIGEQVRDVRPGLRGRRNGRQPIRRNLAAGTFAALVALLVGYSAPFTVYQTEQALVVRLGQPIRVVTEPGLSLKFPFLDSVIRVGNRILDVENPQHRDSNQVGSASIRGRVGMVC